MHMRKKILSIIFFLVALCGIQTFAQTSRVTGKIIGPDNKPVPGASVTISGTTQGTVTDADGNFAITAPSDASLLVNSIGFTEQVIKIDGRSNINVTLSTGQSSGLEEVVVTGYTAQKKKDIVGSVAVVDVKALKAVPSGSAMSALQGQAAGVNVVNNGSPGARSNILIRGVTGFANAPLVMIDGVQGEINDVPASDVESIQVLKDAGAASIYGARGSNGVIIITTKKGKSGAPAVSYESFYNLQVPRSIDKLGLLSTEQYVDIYSKINPTTNLFPGGNIPDFAYRGPSSRGVGNAGDPAVDPSLYKLDLKNPGNNYLITRLLKTGSSNAYDEIMNPALMMQHNITASGGTDRATYLVSFGYLDHQGTLENTFLRRYNVRVNSQVKVRENIRIGENLNIFYKNNPNVTPINGGFGPIQAAISTPPFLPLYDIQGNYAGPFVGPTDELGDWGNPKASADLVSNNRRREYGMQGNAYLEIDFLRHFTARTSFGGTINNFYVQQYTPSMYWSRNGSGNDVLTENSGFATTYQWTNTVQYKNQFGKHNLSVLAGTEAVETSARTLNGGGEKYFLNTYEYLVLGNSGVFRNPSSTGSATSLYSLLGRLDYSYNDKYLLGVTGRRDGFSEFGSDSKYGNFYSVSVGWRLSQEAFMQNISWINDLKVRASYGELGNKETVPAGNAYFTYRQNPFFSFYDIAGTSGGSITSIAQGFFPYRYGNSGTSWETNKATNVGFDATLFNNKLDLSVEYFKKTTEGLLRVLQLPATAGEGISPTVNLGDIQNTGLDINAVYRARVSKDFNFSVGANFTTYKNKIAKLPDPGYADESPRRFQVGYPIGSFFGYKVVGVFKDQKDVDDHAEQQDAAPGRWKYLDANGDGKINDEDRVHYGNTNPDFTLGVNLSASFKNFDFSALLYTAQGQDIYNNTLDFLGSWERGISNKSKKVLDAWSETNPNGTWKKAETIKNFSNSSVPNSAFVEKGSYVRLRNVQFGYTVEPSVLKNIGLTKLRFYVGGTNLFVITKYSGLDPEIPENFGNAGFTGIDAGTYGQEAGVVFGLNVTF